MLFTFWHLKCRFRLIWRWMVGLALLAGALVAHGCHGDDVDHELCAPPAPTMTAR